jgi:hypothetical protein
MVERHACVPEYTAVNTMNAVRVIAATLVAAAASAMNTGS